MSGLKITQFWRLALISISVMTALQVIRVFVALIVYNFGERNGLMLAAAPAVLVFLAPFLIPLLVRLLNPRNSLFLTVGGLLLLRLALQISRDANLNLILSALAVALALMALPLAVGWMRKTDPASGYQMALGVMLGLTLDTGLHSAFLTWDYAWQSGGTPMIVTLAVLAVAFVALWSLRGDLAEYPVESSLKSLLPLALIGPFFMLQMVFLQNVAFAASSTGFSMAWASALVLIGEAVGMACIVILGRQVLPLSLRLLDGALLVVMAVLLTRVSGIG
ncbi:MAG: hypothetical protein K8I60_20020, partial [Anaerolineae bacterium]|nr:hypothetical protein [Anaerolineae bacterium]